MIPPFIENGGPTEPPSVCGTSGQVGPRLSACDELAQRQVQAVQPRDDSARHRLQAIGGKQERNHQINDAAHRVADEEQSHAQQSHDDRGRCQEEGGQGEQEQQDSHKDGQEQDKRCGDQFEYQSHRFDPFLSSFYLYFTMRGQGQQCCRRLVNLVPAPRAKLARSCQKQKKRRGADHKGPHPASHFSTSADSSMSTSDTCPQSFS